MGDRTDKLRDDAKESPPWHTLVREAGLTRDEREVIGFVAQDWSHDRISKRLNFKPDFVMELAREGREKLLRAQAATQRTDVLVGLQRTQVWQELARVETLGGQ